MSSESPIFHLTLFAPCFMYSGTEFSDGIFSCVGHDLCDLSSFENLNEVDKKDVPWMILNYANGNARKM